MNEREAIEFEMQLLKEQSRRDAEFYWDMRQHRNERFKQLQARLGELDELEYSRQYEAPNKATEQLKDLLNSLPTPKAIDLTPVDLMVETATTKKPVRKGKQRGIRPVKVPYNIIVADVIEFLNDQDGPVNLKPIRKFVEEKNDVTYKNFSDVIKKVMEIDSNIKRDESTKKFKYYYQA